MSRLRIALQHDRAIILHGDSSHLGDVLDANSVDAIVTDPPSGIGFMGKGWDGDKGGRDAWIRWLRDLMMPAFRALKPGGHGLVWALPRTSHWTTTALEDCGFEIRDVVMHVFGSGFPKSLDVSKAIDVVLGAEREVVGSQGVPGAQLQAMSNAGNGGEQRWTGEVLGAAVTDEARAWNGWGTALKPAAEHWILVRKPLASSVARNVLTFGTGAVNIEGCRIGASGGTRKEPSDEKCSTDPVGSFLNKEAGTPIDAGRWPSHFALTHAEQCVSVGSMSDKLMRDVGPKLVEVDRTVSFAMGRRASETIETTREVFECAPDCPVRMLDEQSGTSTSRASEQPRGTRSSGFADVGAERGTSTPNGTQHSDSGGASRYFATFKQEEDEWSKRAKDAARRSTPSETDDDSVASRALESSTAHEASCPSGAQCPYQGRHTSETPSGSKHGFASATQPTLNSGSESSHGSKRGTFRSKTALDAETYARTDTTTTTIDHETSGSSVARATSESTSSSMDPGAQGCLFKFTAKPATSEKNAGLSHLTPATGGQATGRTDGSAGLDSPRAGAGRNGGARNTHPTIKPLSLMRWLVRLITPPGGVVLDPFAGSGTTGVAALAEGASFVGCEKGGDDGAYVPILVGRIRHALGLTSEDNDDAR